MIDPFAAPAPVASAHAKIDGLRGRLVLITPTRLEFDVPRSQNDPTKVSNKITADVTVVDGLGPIPAYQDRIATGAFIEGPTYRGVWFNHDRLVKSGGLVDSTKTPLQMTGMVLGRLETYKPGRPSGVGNPWGLVEPTEDDKATARAFLAAQAQGQAAATVAAATPAPDANPFGGDAPF